MEQLLLESSIFLFCGHGSGRKYISKHRLWDVTDLDIDKFTLALLNGAAPVVYGIPASFC
eukprot:m.217574 g.217574  ORF g.217574 m.217574 type:complete len:60 (-) comp16988_c0_seq3:42-221(-)